MKALWAVLATLAVALMLVLVSGCTTLQTAEGDSGGSGGMYTDTWHKMPDGRTVYCLYIEGNIGGYSNGKTPSFECDFAGATVHGG